MVAVMPLSSVSCAVCGAESHTRHEDHWYCDAHYPLRGQALIDTLTRSLREPTERNPR